MSHILGRHGTGCAVEAVRTGAKNKMIFNGLSAYPVDRRNFMRLGAAAGLTAAAAPVASSVSAAPGRIDLSTPEGNMTAWVKLDGRLDGDGVSLGMWDGVVMSVWGQQIAARPLFGFTGFGYSRWLDNGDGTWTKLHKEVGFYTDLASGDILDEWENPYLDHEKVAVWPVYNDPVNFVLKPIVEGGYDPDFRMEFMLPWYRRGHNRISTSQDVNLRWPNLLGKEDWPREHTGEFVRVGEYFQLHAPEDELLDPDVPTVTSVGTWQRIGNYLPWMLMEERPGHLFYRTNTAKLPGGIDELPPRLRAAAEKRFPDYLEPPSVWTEPNVSSFEVYARDASPVPFPEGRTPFQPVTIPEPELAG